MGTSTEQRQAATGQKLITLTPANRAMRMLCQFWEDLATHMYQIEAPECTWGANYSNEPIFQFQFDDTPQNTAALKKFFDDFAQLNSSVNRSADPNNKMFGFEAIDQIVLFLEHLSASKNWGLEMPLPEYVSDLVAKDSEAKSKIGCLDHAPDGSVKFLRQNIYTGLEDFKGEFLAASVADRNNLPAVNFTFTLNEISRCLAAHSAKENPGQSYDSNSVLWFN